MRPPGRKNILIAVLFLLATLLVAWYIRQGLILESLRNVDGAASGAAEGYGSMIAFHHPLSILILQILTIIIFSRMLAYVMSLINQPTVVGEILAGIILGPSLLGNLFPEVSAFIFPVDSLDNLQFLSQIGLMLFMFIIGMELDFGMIRQHAKKALFISNASIIVPFLMGVILAYYLFNRFAGDNSTFVGFALFLGISLSITAFPVLARIVQERGITKSPLGIIAIASAAINDAVAWGILAIVVAIASAGAVGEAGITIMLTLVYGAVMLLGIRPMLQRMSLKYGSSLETVSKAVVAIIFSIMLVSSWVTEVIGIHALFGAFMAGVVMPDHVRFKQIVIEKIEDVALVLLLPLFFVYTGLRTQLGLLNDPDLWMIALIVLAVAVVGKMAGSALAARYMGESWKNSLLLGSLMNTRGLIELIALNIGYDIGVLSPEIFTILVLMAVVTTFMTGPLMSFIEWVFRKREVIAYSSKQFRVLISFGPPEAGGELLKLVAHLFHKKRSSMKVTALHFTPDTDTNIQNAERFEHEAFRIIKQVAAGFGINLTTVYRTANIIVKEISAFANRGKYDLLVVGSARPLIGSDKTGGKLRFLFEWVKSDVGLLIDRHRPKLGRVQVFMHSHEEMQLRPYYENLADSVLVTISCLLPASVSADKEGHAILFAPLIYEHTEPDLIITTLETYRSEREIEAPWIEGNASIFIVNEARKE